MTNWTSCEGEDGYPSFVGHDKAAVMYCIGRKRWPSCVGERGERHVSGRMRWPSSVGQDRTKWLSLEGRKRWTSSGGQEKAAL
jgi:hypothetical protein